MIRVFLLVLLFSFPALADDLCAHIAKGADYVAGVDVRGRGVVPADLNAVESPILDPVRIPVKAGIEIDGLVVEPEVASVEIYQDGRVMYNGQDISSQVKRTCGTEVVVEGRVDDENSLPNLDDGGIEVEVLDDVVSDVIEGQYP